MKNKFKLLSLLPLTLIVTSCSGAGSETKLPSKGTVLEAQDGKTKLASSIDATVTPDKNNDAFGFEIENAHSKTSVIGNVKNKITNSNMMEFTGKESLADGKFFFGFKGITATEGKDIRAALHAGAKLNSETKLTSSIPGVSFEKKFNGKYGINLDLIKEELYVDLVNDATYSLISDIINTFISSSGVTGSIPRISFDLSTIIPTEGKARFAADIDEDKLPIISEKDLAEIKTSFKTSLEDLPEGGEFRDHGKAGFSYSGKLTGDVMEKEINDDLNDKDDDGKDEAKKFTVSTDFTADSYADYAIIFDNTGIKSIGFSYKLSFTFAYDYSQDALPDFGLEASGYNIAFTTELEGGVKFKFLKGADVVFDDLKAEDYPLKTLPKLPKSNY